MKKIFFSLFFFITALGFSQQNDDNLNWLSDLSTAKKIAKEKGKNILIYFTGSDWCAPCKQLKADFFYSEEFISKSKDVVLLMVDLPYRQDIITPEQRKKNEKIIAKYNSNKSFPTLIGMDSYGRIINRISAYSSLRDTSGHFSFLESILR